MLISGDCILKLWLQIAVIEHSISHKLKSLRDRQNLQQFLVTRGLICFKIQMFVEQIIDLIFL